MKGKFNFKLAHGIALATVAMANGALAQTASEPDTAEFEEIVVIGAARTYSAVSTTESMQRQQNPITSVLASIDNLPGVFVTEGDTFGFDDWSTVINLRGYQTAVESDIGQVGITIDGFPNGDSGYGGGTKANRYIDSMNSGGVDITQGIADISTRSTEALGGTLNFRTNDPEMDERMRVQYSAGDFGAQRYYGRYDTGMIFNETTRAWVSFNHNEATDWMEGSAQNERDHGAGKFISEWSNFTLTGYYAWDDIHEDNYQRVTLDEFREDSDWDRLIGTWTNIPYVNQVYRRGWSTNRENTFGYLKLDAELADGLTGNIGIYNHHMEGRGDWIPPYIADLTNDAGGPEYEIQDNLPILGGSQIGAIYFTDAQGRALTATPGCESSITFPYGGAGPQFDPACYPSNAVPVQSFRHTNYERDRDGITLDFEWAAEFSGFDNTLRGGWWYEDSTRYEWRTWHKLEDARVGIDFRDIAYWVQYSREFPRETTMWYLQDQIEIQNLTISLGIREFNVDNSEFDLFGANPAQTLNTSSDTMFTGGATFLTPVDGLELFFGYAENIAPLLDYVLEREGTFTGNLESETTENMELGLRYVSPNLVASAVVFDNQFENRLEFFGPQLAGNIPNYSIGLGGRYDNVGGIESSGFELGGEVTINDNWSIYGSYTNTDATYVGTGLGPAADAALGLNPGNTIVNTPESMWVLSVDWTRNAYSAGLSTKYVDERFMDRGNTLRAPDYTTSDLYVNVRGEVLTDYLQGFEIGFVVNNLFDESYLGGISGFGAWIGAPRTAAFTMTLDF
ncbi:MAG: hypothetical protein RLZZ385_2296 [Pseudomonadota bacterium]|jgi:outer membrane receptor for Fe3+-dicitrate